MSQRRNWKTFIQDKTAKEREYIAAKQYGAIFLMQIGDKLKSGEPHDGRAPDYDDWSLNGDIIVYYDVLDIALELSSMGIRVDETALKQQLEKAGCQDRENLPGSRKIFWKRNFRTPLVEESDSPGSVCIS